MSIKMTKNKSSETNCIHKCKIERILLGSLMVLVLILSGCLLYIAVKLSVIRTSCSTPGCLLAAAQIITFVDPAIDPCDDFFKFACGRYIKDSFGDVTAAPMVKLQKLVELQVEAILKEPIEVNDHYLVKIQKELFQACMNETVAEEESLPVVNGMLDKLRGWPVVVGRGWNETLFDWKDVVCKLRQNGYAFSMMLTIGPVPDPFNTSRYIIRIEQPYIPSIMGKHRQQFKNHMIEIAVIFGAERNLAQKEMGKVMDFMEKLRKLGIKNKWKMQSDNDNGGQQNEVLLNNRLTVKAFQKRNTKINWLDFLNEILHPAASITKDDFVIFPTDEFLEEFFDLLDMTPKRTQANYIIWIALKNILPHLTKELKQSSENYTFLTTGYTGPPMKRTAFCQNEISEGFFPDPIKILYVRKYLPAEKRENIKEMLENIKLEFMTLIMKASWIDDNSKAKVMEKARALIEVIGAPGDYFNDALLEKFEFNKKEDFQKSNFLQMFLHRLKQEVDAAYFRLHKSSDDTKLALFYYLLAQVLAMNSWSENAIFLPAGILQGIFYDENRPMYLNYGAIGAVMGHELTHGFCKDASRYDKDGREGNLWLEDTEKAFMKKTRCLIDHAENFKTKATAQKINGTLTLEENIADNTGVKVAYLAYKTWVRAHGEEEYLTGVHYTPYQLFWISSVLHYCYSTNDDRGKFHKSAAHADNIFRTVEPLRNNPDFAKDFNCPAGSNMNPLAKCQVF